MGYYGASAYRGDYYGQGDYYHNPRGDPGFFDFLSDVGSTVLGAAKTILPVAAPIVGGIFGGPVGMGIGAAAGGLLGRVLSPGAPIQSPPNLSPFSPPPVWAAAAPGTGSTVAMIPATPASFTGLRVGGPSGLSLGVQRTPMPGGSKVLSSVPPLLKRPRGMHIRGAHHRRMNSLNPRALSRALRRARGFQKYATKVLKLVGEKRHVDGFKKHRKGKR